jgi:hypothetical protein
VQVLRKHNVFLCEGGPHLYEETLAAVVQALPPSLAQALESRT